MNTNILQKCIAELDQVSPRLDYIRGMLETLIEMAPKIDVIDPPKPEGYFKAMPTPGITIRSTEVIDPAQPPDEASLLDSVARNNLDKVRKLAGVSVETT